MNLTAFVDSIQLTLEDVMETEMERFLYLYEADPGFMRKLANSYERLQEIIDFSDEDYADWKVRNIGQDYD